MVGKNPFELFLLYLPVFCFSEILNLNLTFAVCHKRSLSRRRNLIPDNNVCNAVLLGPNGFNELPEMCFGFPFNLVNHVARTQIAVHKWCPEQGFWRCFADGFNQKLLFIQNFSPILMG